LKEELKEYEENERKKSYSQRCYLCKLCNKQREFSTLSPYTQSMLRLESQNNSRDTTLIQYTASIKEFECSFCQSTAIAKSSLKGFLKVNGYPGSNVMNNKLLNSYVQVWFDFSNYE
jgi:hypothetical protein